MELCLMIEGQDGVTWEQWVAIARACEQHGVPELFRSDHQLNLGGREDLGSLDAWTTLAALGAVTSTVRLGTLVSPATFRHPSTLAKAVVVADHASGGRVSLGLGAGWHEREHAAYGYPFPPLRERMDRLEEQLEIVHGHWADGPFSFEGPHYGLRDLDAQPKPVQRPHPPVLLGGAAGPRAARLAARWADEYNTTFPSSLEEIRERRERIAAACEDAGRPPIPFSVMTGFVAGRDRAEYERRAAALAEQQGIDELPPGWITGTPDQAREQLAGLRDAGVARVMLQNLLHDDLDVVALIGELRAGG
jgi:F420-dependent oxidoreductase-like protein